VVLKQPLSAGCEVVQRLSKYAIWSRCAILGFALAPLIQVFGDNPFLPWDWFRCPVRDWTGVPCPSCGIPCAFLAIAQGDFSGAIAFHLFSPLIFASFVGLAGHLPSDCNGNDDFGSAVGAIALEKQ
jgi:hypothetical protein